VVLSRALAAPAAVGLLALGVAASLAVGSSTAGIGSSAALGDTTTDQTPRAEPGPGASTLPVLAKAAPELVPGGEWFNSRPLTLAGLHGKVVLVDFWTYSCINCLRTLPHLKAWYAAYRKDGLVIVGVHSPEFAFEHVAANVSAAIERLGIEYPVVQDNAFATWKAYGNDYWPAEFLIDRSGQIRVYHVGEGGYDEMERDIEDLLGVGTQQASAVPDRTPVGEITPELYLGYGRLDVSHYAGAVIARDRLVDYPAAKAVPLHSLSYSGGWRIARDVALAGAHAGLALRFEGRDVYIVLGGRGRVTATLAGGPAKTFVVNANRLYMLERFSAVRTGLLRLELTPGVRAYSFTFG
jgi:thiol-disulfide isomerase/thioredoxin